MKTKSNLQNLSVLDYFAGIALQGLLANPNNRLDGELASREAYGIADWMMVERKLWLDQWLEEQQ